MMKRLHFILRAKGGAEVHSLIHKPFHALSSCMGSVSDPGDSCSRQMKPSLPPPSPRKSWKGWGEGPLVYNGQGGLSRGLENEKQ